MSKPIYARVKIIRGPRPGNGLTEDTTMEIDASELQEGDIILEYIPD